MSRKRRASLVELVTSNSFKELFSSKSETYNGPFLEIKLIQGKNLPIRDFTGKEKIFFNFSKAIQTHTLFLKLEISKFKAQ
jgi:hypothetical protein